MKIAFVNQPFEGVNYSISIVTNNIVRELLKYDNPGIVYYVNKQLYKPDEDDLNPAVAYKFISTRIDTILLKPLKMAHKIFCAPQKAYFSSPFYYLAYVLAIAFDLRKQRCNIVHIHNFSQFVPIIRFFNPTIKIVLHMHCLWLTQLDEKTIRGRIKKADLIIGCSDFVIDKVKKKFPEVSDKCFTVFNGVDQEHFAEENENVYDKDGTSKILYVGRVSPEKGVHVLLNAFKRLAGNKAELHIVGALGAAPYDFMVGLSEEEEVKSLARYYRVKNYLSKFRKMVPAGIYQRFYHGDNYSQNVKKMISNDSPNIFLHGAVSHAKIKDFYNQADVVVVPSIIGEAFGIPIVEAMMARKPVIGSNKGGIPEIIEDGATGVLTGPANEQALAQSIEHLLGNASLREKMGSEGRKRAFKLFTWKTIGYDLFEKYQALSLT